MIFKVTDKNVCRAEMGHYGSTLKELSFPPKYFCKSLKCIVIYCFNKIFASFGTSAFAFRNLIQHKIHSDGFFAETELQSCYKLFSFVV